MMEIILLSLLIIFGIQILFFIFASIFKTDKVTDLAYGLTFVILSWILLINNKVFDIVHVLLTLMITFWGLRLAGYLFYRILRIKKDDRFNGIRENFWKFAAFWVFQTVLILIIMLPVIMLHSIHSTLILTASSVIGFGIWLFGFLTETIADQQKFKFRNNPKNKNKWIDKGLWRYSRHPNYFGEILCWIGVFVYILPVLTNLAWISIASPLSITVSLLFFSGIPLLEKKEDERYDKNKKYREYKKSTSVLIPWFKI
jgi:steroid 5-alpha reductase family enzyme